MLGGEPASAPSTGFVRGGGECPRDPLEMPLRCLIWGEQWYFGVPAELAGGHRRLRSRSRVPAAPGAGSAGSCPAQRSSAEQPRAAYCTTLGPCSSERPRKLLGCRPRPGQPVGGGRGCGAGAVVAEAPLGRQPRGCSAGAGAGWWRCVGNDLPTALPLVFLAGKLIASLTKWFSGSTEPPLPAPLARSELGTLNQRCWHPRRVCARGRAAEPGQGRAGRWAGCGAGHAVPC